MKSILLENGINKGNLPSLYPLLKQWQSIIEATTKEWIKSKDALWWYNERASLGLLAGAVWQLKGFVFEEYTTLRKIHTQRRVSYKHGRCDMEFRLGRQYYIAESKQCWPTLGLHKERALPIVKSELEQARSQVAQVKANGYHPLAIAFVVPKIPVNYDNKEHNLQANLSEFIRELSSLPKTTVAWVFPKETRGLRTPKDNRYYGYFFPGVILVAKSCKA